MGKTEGPGKGRETMGVREREEGREWVRGRRGECGMGLKEGRIGRRDWSLICLQVRSWLVDESG